MPQSSSVSQTGGKNSSIEHASKTPKLKELKDELNQAITDSSSFYQRMVDADDTRFCIWDGQNSDGKKHAEDLGKEPFPWEGSSDTRVRTADMIVNRHVRLMKAAFFRGKVQSSPVEATDMVHSHSMSTLLKWMFQSQMLMELRREVELLAQWRQSYGSSILGITWDESVRWEMDFISLEGLKQVAVETKNAQLLAILDLVFDPLQEDGLAEVLMQMSPGIDMADARKVVRNLREKGESEFPKQYLFRSRPRWQAYRTGIDVFFPANTSNIQRSRFVGVREWVTETELKERILTEGYDAKFVDECLKHKGVSCRSDLEYRIVSNRVTGLRDTRTVEDYKDMIELFHVYYKATHKKATKVFCTVFHHNVNDYYAKHDDDGYKHGEYPFIPFVNEWAMPTILESRGVPEIVMTWQNEIKTQRDYRADRASIAILPPLKVPSNRGKMNALLGPGSQIPERRAGEVSWLNPPAFDQGTIEIEKATRRDVDEYFGLTSDNVPLVEAQLAQQSLVDDFLLENTVAMMMTFQLMQEFMSDEEVARVVGPQRQPFRVSRQEIQGKFDLLISFDIRDLDTEYLIKKMELIQKIAIPIDTVGVIDRAGLVKFVMAAIDPNLAEQYVKSAEAASQQEIEDEQVQLTKLVAGLEAPMKESGQNHELRLQVLMNALQSNPNLQQRYGADKVFKQLIDARAKHFKFMLEQQENAKIGRLGVRPAMGFNDVQGIF